MVFAPQGEAPPKFHALSCFLPRNRRLLVRGGRERGTGACLSPAQRAQLIIRLIKTIKVNADLH